MRWEGRNKLMFMAGQRGEGGILWTASTSISDFHKHVLYMPTNHSTLGEFFVTSYP
jgi:hypothetical protein